MTRSLRLYPIVTLIYTLLQSFELSHTFLSDSNVAGYEPFSRLQSNDSIIGLLWTVDSTLYASQCHEEQLACQDEKLLYDHTLPIIDMDIYFDGRGVYFVDVDGQIFWLDLSSDLPVINNLNITLAAEEVCVDWLSRQLYVSTSSAQIYRCDMNTLACATVHSQILPYQPKSLVADPYNGYLYWLTDTGSLVKHDLSRSAASNVTADVAIADRVQTYSVAFDHYDLYSIYRYNDTYSEITLTFLNGYNQRTHIPLNHSSDSRYSQLNCFHDLYCLWLASDANSTSIWWHLQSDDQKTIAITNLNVTDSSLMKQWHRQVQPIPIPQISPDYSNIFADTTTIEIHWDKPDILASLIRTGKILALWRSDLFVDKYMQSDAAWSNWTYELNIVSADGADSPLTINTKLLSYRMDNCRPGTTYNISILAKNDYKRSDARRTSATMLTADPTMYIAAGAAIQSIDVFGKITSANATELGGTICDMEAGEDNSLYIIRVAGVDLAGEQECIDRTSASLFHLDITPTNDSSDSRVLRLHNPEYSITAISYDWIGKMLYIVVGQRAIARLIRFEKAEPLIPNLSDSVKQLVVDSIGGFIYWSTRRRVYACELGNGPDGDCLLNDPLRELPAFGNSRFHGLSIDVFTRTLYWTEIRVNGVDLLSRDLVTGTQKPPQPLTLSSNLPIRVAEGKAYLISQGVLHSIDLRTNKISNYSHIDGLMSLAYVSSKSHPLLPGMHSSNTTEIVNPAIDAMSIMVIGEYSNFSIEWTLKTPTIPDISVKYSVTLKGGLNGETIYQADNSSESSVSDILNLLPQTRLWISIQPYTKWGTGENFTKVLESPAAVPDTPLNISMFLRYAYKDDDKMRTYMVIRWKPPSFTGGVILDYNVTVFSQDGERSSNASGPEAVVPVQKDVMYNVTVRARTKAGSGNWSPEVSFVGRGSPLPLISGKPYTPKSLEVMWKLDANVSHSLYNYTVVYNKTSSKISAEDLRSAVKPQNEFHMIEELESDTEYSFKMEVCCLSKEMSLWFAGHQCDFTNSYTAKTFIKPEALKLTARSADTIALTWSSPRLREVVSHYVKYKPNGEAVRYLMTTSEATVPDYEYSLALGQLKSDTEYDIVLVLAFPQYTNYMIPGSDEDKFIVITNQSKPGRVTVLSMKCDKETCLVKTEGDLRYSVKILIQCPGMESSEHNVNSDGIKEIQRSILSEDISECTVSAWGENSVGRGLTSAALSVTEETGPEADSLLAVSLSVMAAFVVVLVVIALYIYRRRQQSRKRKAANRGLDNQIGLTDMSSANFPDHNGLRPALSSTLMFSMTDNALYDSEGIVKYKESTSDYDSLLLQKYDRKKLLLTRFLGSGAFGEVYEGKAKDIVSPDLVTLVAVKTLRPDASAAYKEEFVKEAKLMSQFDNEYIVKLLGVCIDRDPHYIIIELMNQGDLVAFLRKSRPTKERAGTLSLSQLVSICRDVAAGCKYLEMLHFVHRDLAARNCLVSTADGESQHRVKIGDFGLARDIYRNDYYRKEGEALLPVRWMSPEALVDGVFTTQSDIWAFGIMMWEVFTLAMQPYPARSNIDVLQFVTNSGTLDKPVRCPQTLFNTMLQCWNFAAIDRPPFREIFRRLTDFQTDHMTANILDQFNQANRRLISDSEFFAGSTSSGAGVRYAASESPVFEPDRRSFDKDVQNNIGASAEEDNENSFGFSVSTGNPMSSNSAFRSFKNLFRSTKRQTPHHLLERMHSSPADVSSRSRNRYVRSDSTMSADGNKPTQTYTQGDGRQLSFEAPWDLLTPADNEMDAISEEKLGQSRLCVNLKDYSSDSAIRPDSFKCSDNSKVPYSTMAFNPSSASIPQKVAEDSLSSINSLDDNGRSVDEPPLQYSTILFNVESDSSARDSGVQYSTTTFGTALPDQRADSPPILPEQASKNDDYGGSLPLNDSPVQYSSMQFNEAGTTAADSPVDYTAIAFGVGIPSQTNQDIDAPRENTDTSGENTDTPRKNIDTLRGVTSMGNTDTGISRESSNIPREHNGIPNDSLSSRDDNLVQYSPNLVSKTFGDKPVQYSTMNFNSQPSINKNSIRNEEARAASSTFPRKIAPSIQKTPLGTKVNYTSEPFKHPSSLNRRKKQIYPHSAASTNTL